MAETAWTKGPWTLETVRTSSGLCHKIGPFPWKPDRENHACIYVDYPSRDGAAARDQELLANARLIAAAPAMAEALEAHQEWADKENAGPQYPPGMSRDAPGGEEIWRAWWNEQLDLCDRASKLTRTALALARGQEQETK